MASKKKASKKKRPKRAAKKRAARKTPRKPVKRPAKKKARKRAGVVKRTRIGGLKVEVRKMASGYQSRVCTPVLGMGATPVEALKATRRLLGGRASGGGSGGVREQRMRRLLAGR